MVSYGITVHKIGSTPLTDYCREAAYELGIGDLAGEGAISEPYAEGFKSGEVTLKGRDYPLGLTILGQESNKTWTEARYQTNVQALAALIFNGGDPFTLTRILTLSAGVQTCTITARYRDGFRVQRASFAVGRVAPVLTLLDARWAISGGGTSII